MPSNPDPSDTDESISRYLRFQRRPLLKALGVGAGLSVGSGGATAGSASADSCDDDEKDDEEDEKDDDEPVSRELHRVFGLGLAADEDAPADVDPVQVVELDVEEEEDIHEGFPLQPDPENPEQMIEVPEEFIFDPVGIHVQPGDVVHYDTIAHLHTVTAFHEKYGEEMFPLPTRIPEGAPGFTSPLLVDDEGWLYEFTEPGVYDIFCLPHLFFGMVQRVVVGDPADAEAPAEPSELVGPNAQAVLTASELDPQQIAEQGTVGWRDLTLEMEAPPEPPEEEAEEEAAATVRVREHEEHGDILVGAEEMTLYMFDQDTQGEGSSACLDDCAETWPPLGADGAPVAGEGVRTELTAFEREDGTTQVAANGWPLYHFSQDEAPGDANGQGVGGNWWVLQPNGSPLRSE